LTRRKRDVHFFIVGLEGVDGYRVYTWQAVI